METYCNGLLWGPLGRGVVRRASSGLVASCHSVRLNVVPVSCAYPWGSMPKLCQGHDAREDRPCDTKGRRSVDSDYVRA